MCYVFSFVNQCRVQNEFISLDTHWSTRLRANGGKGKEGSVDDEFKGK